MHLLLLLFTISTATNANAFGACKESFCPPADPQHEALSPGVGRLIGHDQNGCACIENTELISCFGTGLCKSMPKSFPLKNKVLKISNTRIKQFKYGDFENLEQLVDLQLEGNYDLESISSGTFQNLNNLVNLSISFNTKLKTLDKNAFLGLANLKQLFLKHNAFSNLYEVSFCLRPTVVPKLLSLNLDSNSFLKIHSKDFTPLENSTLIELSLALCRIEYIHPNAMVPLKNLQTLQLGENNIKCLVLTDMLEKMIEANINLKTLHLFHMGFKKNPPRSLMELIAKTNITELNLSRNQFEVLTNDSFPFMPNVEILHLLEVLTRQVTDDAFDNLPNLNTLLIAGNKLFTIPTGIVLIKNLTFLDMEKNSPAGNFHPYFSRENVQFARMEKLLNLKLGLNGLPHIFNSSFIGMKKLKFLELQSASIFYIENNSFVPLENLRLLNLKDNPMTRVTAIPDIFFTLTKLETLYLGGCGYKYVTKKNNPFRNLQSLKYLGLENNHLVTIGSTDFQPLIAVRVIDLSSNQIKSWEVRLFAFKNTLQKLFLSKNKISYITASMLEDFANMELVDLDQNAILCQCLATYMPYKKWQSSTNNDFIVNGSVLNPNINCTYPDEFNNVKLVDFLTKPQYGEHTCSYRPPGRIYLYVLLIILVLFVSALAGILFYFRRHIKYWLFLSKLYHIRKSKIRPEKKGYCNYEYDAFVSYSSEDSDFVEKLVLMMENFHPFLKLCVYERDFQIGTVISESVLESVAKSRKTVLVVSDNYVKSQWCQWESQICQHYRIFFENNNGNYVDDSLILIKLGPINERHLSLTLKYLLKTRIYLEWDERKQNVFWNKLRQYLGPPINEITHM